MGHYRCDTCGKIEEAGAAPAACPTCGAAAATAYPDGAASSEALLLDSVEHLFDLEPRAATEAQRKAPSASARLKHSVPAEASKAPAAPGPLAAQRTVQDLPAPSAPKPPLVAQKTLQDLVVGAAAKAAPPATAAPGPSVGLAAVKTLELGEGELEEEVTGPVLREVRPGNIAIIDGLGSPRELTAAPRSGDGLASLSTMEIKDEDLVAAMPPAMPERRRSPVNTQELDEEDIVDVSPPPRPAALAPGEPVVAQPRSMRGRVAFPLAGDEQAPQRSPRPSEVDELAVAGEPPLPPRKRRPLRGQTEELRAIKARKRRRSALLVAGPVVAVLGIGAVVYLVSRPAPSVPVVVNDASPTSPDQRTPDRPRADVARPDVQAPDAAIPDTATRRLRPPLVAKKAIKGEGAAAKVAAPKAELDKAGAMAAYQDGLQRLLRGESAEAVRLFNEALAKNRGLGIAYRGLGLAHERLGQKAKAKTAFQQYLKRNPSADDSGLIRKRLESLE
jgi:hypothetical protein